MITTTAAPTETNWTTVGEWFTEDRHAEILGVIDGLIWVPIETAGDGCPVLAVQAVIQGLKVPRVDFMSTLCVEMAPYGFIGIQGHYKNGRARVFALDRGSDIVPLVSMLWEEANHLDALEAVSA